MNGEGPAQGRASTDARDVGDNDTPTEGQRGVLTVLQRRRWSPLTVDGILARPAATAQAHDLAMALGRVMRRDGTFLPLRGPDDSLCVEVNPVQRDRVLLLLELSPWSWDAYVRRWVAARLAHRCHDLGPGSIRLFLDPVDVCPVPSCGEPLPSATDEPEPDIAPSNDERGSEQRSMLRPATETVLIRGDASRDEEGDAGPRGSGPEVRGSVQQGVSESTRRLEIVATSRARCPECGAASAEPGYEGHGMHCRKFRIEA